MGRVNKMKTLTFITLLFYAITYIVCTTSATCPCHIPCSGKVEICTCYGECGDDGYGCTKNGDDYQFLSQTKCEESKWIVQCVRQSKCSKKYTLDDTNPFAAYEQTTNNMIKDSFDSNQNDDIQSSAISSAASLTWFGGNWFDFWGKNSDQFFGEESMENDITSSSSQRTLQNVKSIQKQLISNSVSLHSIYIHI